jgi:hypothetical protein
LKITFRYRYNFLVIATIVICIVACRKSDSARTIWLKRLANTNWKVSQYESAEIDDRGKSKNTLIEHNIGIWKFAFLDEFSNKWTITYTGSPSAPIFTTAISADEKVLRAIYSPTNCVTNCVEALTVIENTASSQVWMRVTPDYASGIRKVEKYTLTAF